MMTLDTYDRLSLAAAAREPLPIDAYAVERWARLCDAGLATRTAPSTETPYGVASTTDAGREVLRANGREAVGR